jgi:hypothetical protein
MEIRLSVLQSCRAGLLTVKSAVTGLYQWLNCELVVEMNDSRKLRFSAEVPIAHVIVPEVLQESTFSGRYFAAGVILLL